MFQTNWSMLTVFIRLFIRIEVADKVNAALEKYIELCKIVKHHLEKKKKKCIYNCGTCLPGAPSPYIKGCKQEIHSPMKMISQLWSCISVGLASSSTQEELSHTPVSPQLIAYFQNVQLTYLYGQNSVRFSHFIKNGICSVCKQFCFLIIVHFEIRFQVLKK